MCFISCEVSQAFVIIGHSFIHAFNKCLWSTNYVPRSGLGAEDTTVHRAGDFFSAEPEIPV